MFRSTIGIQFNSKRNLRDFVKINNQYGQYKGPRIKIEIKNEVPRDEKKEKETKREIEVVDKEIKKQEEMVNH